MTTINLDDFLLEVERPSRYTNNEYNSIHKDWDTTDIKVALAFPDIYEIGMSNLGLKILYYIINSRPDTLAERVYSPWVDMEKALTSRNRPLFSLESKRPLKEFDIIGFTLQYEMSYTNVLHMLKLSHIPLKSADRMSEKYPLVIAGGPCAFNPEPLADFIDVFVIGDGEEAIVEFLDNYKKVRQLDKQSKLIQLSRVQGIYVPALYDVSYNSDQTIKEITPKYRDVPANIKKRVTNLENAPYPDKFIIPNLNIVHNRAIMEVMRGCIRGCRFCQATMIYRPARVRSKENVKQLLEQILTTSGFEEVSFSSLSTSDYPEIYPLLSELIEKYEKQKVSFSLPSLRADNFSINLANLVQQVRKSGLTFAPEAGTMRLRNIINKNLTDDNLINSVGAAYKAGWKGIKLYFMIGLPFETHEDIEGLVSLVKRLKFLYKGLNLNVNVSPFVPKAFSVFQWHNQESIEQLRTKKDYLKKHLPTQLKWHTMDLSFLEAIFARGNRKLGQVLANAVENGCRFDQWAEYFNFTKWQEAFKKAGVGPGFYANRVMGQEEVLPWSHIDTGVSQEFLWTDYQKAKNMKTTPDCHMSCSSCGVEDCQMDIFRKIETLPAQMKQLMQQRTILPPLQKIRVKFSKKGEAKYISHLELMVMFNRALRRAKIPMAYSQGFNPHPKISFGPPLAVGFESETELVDIELTNFSELSTMIKNLSREMPPGISILEGQAIPLVIKSLSASINGAVYQVAVEGQMTGTLPAYIQVTRAEGNVTELLMQLPLGEKNVRPDKLCAELFAPGYKIKQIKRIKFLFK
ncbi:MAG: TIGR03960 family B12-binding radical SAM protein [Elusimicrobia bacterium]|nr:TIGR03960 family B12-binding radical SAM protein [Elusimicrobiota bacterium]